MSASDPRIFDHLETVVTDASTGRSYTPADYRKLFDDAHLSWAKPIADYYIGFVEFADPSAFPNVDVYAEKGSGIETARRASVWTISRSGRSWTTRTRSSRATAT